MNIFLIDDDDEDRKTFLMALNALDSSYQLETAENGVKALERLRAGTYFLPDYIFLDMNMPYMSGRECLAKLRGIERLKNVPIILYSTIKDFEELADGGATGFITKKNSVAELVKALSDIIK